MQFLNLLILVLAALVSSGLADIMEKCSRVPKDTYIAVENDCRSYIYCAADAEESFQEACPIDTYFDENISECVVDEYGICLNKKQNVTNSQIITEEEEEEEDAEGETNVIVTEKNEVKNKTTPKPSVDVAAHRPICNPLENSFHPHPVRCEYYYRCVHGFLTIFRCNFSHAWDHPKQMCLPHKEAQCYGHSKIRRSL
ncbi:uncharacterized protein LOC101893435 [Musca domestica]|uniref:Uncharacterized protein LOC101893435 n=1 Tax=Musca domestica TaxID=7370 RepID=A0A1I8M8G3_MUSDO|nr:uncharacterized protein LOC101893435 [Musca domestica]